MKHMKWFVVLAVVVMLLMVAIPAAADDPFGGPPSKTSGNGTNQLAAVYIAGTFDKTNSLSAPSLTTYSSSEPGYVNPNSFSLQTGVVSSYGYTQYPTNWSAKVTVPAGGSRWFKFDTVKSRDVEIYVDDVPKWGAAYRYFTSQFCYNGNKGVNTGNGGCDNADNLERIGIDTSEIGKWWTATQNSQYFVPFTPQNANGFAVRLYDPDNIKRMDYFWPTPNNALLTMVGSYRPRVADSQGSYGGYIRGGCSPLCAQWGWENQTGGTYIWMDPGDRNKAGDGNTHLFANKYHWDGWVYARVFNDMIWDGDVVVGTRFTPNAKYDFPCDQCPYPYNPGQ